ncbi:MAG TPA: hypothetical protein VF344_00525 [Candidatus Limnocylindrales bacterium]
MNTRIDSVASAITMQAAVAINAPAKKAAPAAVPAPASPPATPAVKVQMTSVPASVAADDRATYLQILKSNGGNAGAALAAIQAMEAKEQNG